MDAKWEIAATLAIGAATLAFYAWHKGAGTVVPAPAPSLAQTVNNDASNATAYDPAANVPNGFDVSPDYSFPISTTPVVNQFNLSAPVPANAFNVSSGTPQCQSCDNTQISDLESIVQAQQNAFASTLAALASLGPTQQPQANVYVTTRPVTVIVQKVAQAVTTFTQLAFGETLVQGPAAPEGIILGGDQA